MSSVLRLDRAYPILIFKAGRHPLSHGALGVARSLGSLGVPVYAIVEDRFTPLASSRYVTRSFVWERWPAEPKEFLQKMSGVAAAIGMQTMLLPLDDLSAVWTAEEAPTLGEWFRLPKIPPALPRQLANKAFITSLCSQIGVPSARSEIPRSPEDIENFAARVGLPIVVKAAEQWTIGDTLNCSTLVIRDSTTLHHVLEQCGDLNRSPLIVQEYIDGEDWIYSAYSNSETNVHLGFTGRKLLSDPPGAGATTLGLALRNADLSALADHLLKNVSYSGICDTDWRRDSRDGQYKLLDFNPRIGLNFQMFENADGVDVVRALHLDLSGRSIGPAPSVEGRLLVVEPSYALARLRGAAPLARDIKRAVSSRKPAWWNAQDPLPFLVMVTRIALPALARRWKRLTAVVADLLRKPDAPSIDKRQVTSERGELGG